jgi:drug/metabolite transporter (DMT)-like permease
MIDKWRQRFRVRELSPGQRGVIWMLLASLLFTAINANAKYLSLDYDVVQVIRARYAFHMMLLALYLRTRLPTALVSSRPRMQWLRSLMTMVATSLILVSAHLMPLAEVSAILFLAPLFVTLLSAPLLGERVGAHR